jgi:pimeloyl-ACP methyl ester carboxylesterase
MDELTPRFCAVSQLAYLESGSGSQTLVWVHGWASFKEIWLQLKEATAPYARSYAPDLPGHGASPIGSARRMQDVAERVLAFCTARQIERCVLIGHSMGGNVAVEMTLARPELVEKLILLDPALLTGAMPVYTRTYLRQRLGWPIWRGSMVAARMVDQVGKALPQLKRVRLASAAINRLGRIAGHDPEGTHRLLGGLFENPLDAKLHQITVPTLLVGGVFDPLVPASSTRKIARGIPNAKYVEFFFGAHNPMDERPTEIARLIVDFLGFHQSTEIPRI